ncbi:Saxitoxin and tetrodotoxin-binding protein 1 Precursor [Channa argus]|uniref:Saxitoxin and tetrodotoxin-binding protein 1 n=1 Tax=Channa argus TaxID=215402 RepID=A0A6G1PU67_CHAAH|nr:Saxitoxin and tetrodotoxin-binding protein 1 Precursor [Channa argus]
MCFLSLVSAVTLLLSLTAASPTPDDCVHLNRTLSAEGLHVIFGKWILHEAYALSSHDISSQILKTINSSQIEFVRTENNHTVIFKHAIMRDETCTRYSVNFTVVGNKIQHSPTINSTYESHFLETCDGCLLMHYTFDRSDGNKDIYLLFYRKAAMLPQTGQEMDKRQARCLGFLHPPDFTYNQAELCPEKSNDKETKEAQQ